MGGGGGVPLFCVHESTLRRQHSWVMKTLGWKSRGLGIEYWYGQVRSYTPPCSVRKKMLVWAGWNLCLSPQRQSKGCGLCAHYKPCFSAPLVMPLKRHSLFPMWMNENVYRHIYIYIYSAFHPRPCMFTVKCGTVKYTQYRERKIQTGWGGGGGERQSVL